MRAAIYHEHGDPSVLRVEKIADPVIERDHVLIRVAGVGVNRLDVQQRRGPGVMPGFSLPHIAGMDIAGTVAATGPDVRTFRAGDRVVVNPRVTCGRCPACAAGDDRRCARRSVIGAALPGGYAELCAVPESNVHRVPDGVTLLDAAASVTAMTTAWRAVVQTGRVCGGETVVVNAANSGVSTFAIQVARALGGRVIAIARSEAKLEAARRLGAEFAINSIEEDVVARVRQFTDGRGADVVVDHVGRAVLDVSLRSLAAGGRLVVCGATSGGEASVDLAYVYRMGITIAGVEAYSRQEFTAILEWLWASGVEPLVDTYLPLDDAASAHERMERNEVIGKLVIVQSEGASNDHI